MQWHLRRRWKQRRGHRWRGNGRHRRGGAGRDGRDPVSQFTRSTTSDGEGKFNFPNIPPNNYHLTVTGAGFVSYAQDVDVHGSLPVSLKITLQVGAMAETVNVQSEAGDLVEQHQGRRLVYADFSERERSTRRGEPNGQRALCRRQRQPCAGVEQPYAVCRSRLLAQPRIQTHRQLLRFNAAVPFIFWGCASPHSTFYPFVGHTDVKELALYAQDNISWKNWNFNLGIRGDLYNGLTTASQAEPRIGLAYNIHKTNTVLRLSYARTMETPFNENLVLSSTGCLYPVIAALAPCIPSPLNPGYRNEFHAGLQQAFGKYVVVSGEDIWKYTHNAFDFSVLDNTPITFPIEWHNSKIPGWALRVSVPNYHGFSALAVMSSVSARFFPPQVGGLA